MNFQDLWHLSHLALLLLGLVSGTVFWVRDTRRAHRQAAELSQAGYEVRARPTQKDVALLTSARLPALGGGLMLRNVVPLAESPTASMLAAQLRVWHGLNQGHFSQTQSVLLLRSEHFSFPPLLLQPQRARWQRGRLFSGANQIALLENPAMTAQFFLSGLDVHTLVALFRPELCTVCLQHPGLVVSARGHYLAICRAGQVVPAAELGAFITWAQQVARHFAEAWAAAGYGRRSPRGEAAER